MEAERSATSVKISSLVEAATVSNLMKTVSEDSMEILYPILEPPKIGIDPPLLKELAFIAFGQAFNQYWYQGISMTKDLMDRVVNFIPTDIDLLKAIIAIGNDNIYWERRTKDTWPFESFNNYRLERNKWKQLCLEKYLGEYIDNLTPQDVDYVYEEKVLRMFEPFIYHLNIKQLKVNPYDQHNEEVNKKIVNKLCTLTDTEPEISDDYDYDNEKYGSDGVNDNTAGGSSVYKNKKKKSKNEKIKKRKRNWYEYFDENDQSDKDKALNILKTFEVLSKEEQAATTLDKYQQMEAAAPDDSEAEPVYDPWRVQLPFGHKCKCTQKANSRVHLASFLTKLKKLKTLIISFGLQNYNKTHRCTYARIMRHEFDCFIISLLSLDKLRYLKIHYTYLKAENVKTITICCKLMPALKTLELTKCTISDDSVKYFKYLFTGEARSRLKALNLSDNRLTDDGVQGIMESLIVIPLPSINCLDFSFNPIGSRGAAFVAKAVVKNINLRTIIISNISMDYHGIINICQAVFNSTFLRVLDTSCNNLGSEVDQHILKAINKNQTLERWCLNECNIGKDALNEVNKKLLENRLNKIRNSWKACCREVDEFNFSRIDVYKQLNLNSHVTTGVDFNHVWGYVSSDDDTDSISSFGDLDDFDVPFDPPGKKEVKCI